MKSILGKMRKSQKGFTLIELIVVIAILAILAAILIPSVSGMIKSANQSADNANARTCYMAAQLQANTMLGKGTPYDNTKTYTATGPAATDASAITGAAAGCATTNIIADIITNKLLANLPDKAYISEVKFNTDGTVDSITYQPSDSGRQAVTYDGKAYTYTAHAT